MLRSRTQTSLPRRGVILVVVLALLTLFAMVGLAFLLYADAAATSSRLRREAESASRADAEPELLLAHFLGQLVYDTPDDESGVTSALRGHSLARSMYGFSDGGYDQTPFNGTGRLHGTYANPFGLDDYYLV